MSVAGSFTSDFVNTGVLSGRIVYNSTSVVNCTLTASMNDYSNVMGAVGSVFFASLSFCNAFIGNDVAFSWLANAIFVGSAYNSSLEMQNSAVMSKVTVL